MKKKEGGFFLIEALISIVIFTMLLLSLFSMISFLQRRIVRSNFESDAGLLLQEGMEIGRTTVLAGWSEYTNGTYHPVFDEDAKSWTLSVGSESALQAKYNRSIEVKEVCRDVSGEKIEGVPCAGSYDKHSREITTKLTWQEKGEEKSLSASLMLINTNE